jgi:hypothetical protein
LHVKAPHGGIEILFPMLTHVPHESKKGILKCSCDDDSPPKARTLNPPRGAKTGLRALFRTAGDILVALPGLEPGLFALRVRAEAFCISFDLERKVCKPSPNTDQYWHVDLGTVWLASCHFTCSSVPNFQCSFAAGFMTCLLTSRPITVDFLILDPP